MVQSIQTKCIMLTQAQYSTRTNSVVMCASLRCCDIALGDVIKRTFDVCMGHNSTVIIITQKREMSLYFAGGVFKLCSYVFIHFAALSP